MTRIRALLRRFALGARGSATIEFVLLFPVFIGIFSSAFEAGLLTSRQVMLERATDIVVRDLRLGIGNIASHDELKTEICGHVAIMPDCLGSLRIELVKIDESNWSLPTGGAPCIDRDEEIEPAINYTPGVANELMLVRVCVVFRPFNPVNGLGLKLPRVNSSDYGLVSANVFVNEPS